MSTIPTGTVTFLFTDVEDSTPLWESEPEAMRVNLARHDALLRGCIEAHGGYIFKTMGDEFCVSFATAGDAVRAAIEAQLALGREEWEGGVDLKVRMALHSDVAEVRDGDYFGAGLSRVARFRSLGYGGLILLSETARDLARDHVPPEVTFADLGLHRLRGFSREEHVYQLKHPELPADFPPLRSASVRPNNLPHLLSSFVGRAEDQAAVRGLLDRARLVTLSGPGGCGKTRLAMEVATDLVRDFSDGVWLVQLAAISDPALLTQAIADVLGVREEASKTLAQSLAQFLAERELLLVMDNCEHLVDDCAGLSRWMLERAPKLRILATSREPFHVQGEAIWAVRPLAIPSIGPSPDPAEVSSFESVRLFLERAADAGAGLVLTSANVKQVVSICRSLDGIPLAIELAAARLNAMSLADLAAGMAQRFSLLRSLGREAAPHHQTLMAAIDWSYDLLLEEEQRFFRKLSVFSGGWTSEAAPAVCGENGSGGQFSELLTRLVEKSLVVLSGEGDRGRYRMLESIGAYAADKLEESGEAEMARNDHCQWFLSLAESAEEELRMANQAEWLARLEEELDNFRAAMRYAEGAAQEAGLRIATALGRFWSLRAHLTEGRGWIESFLARDGGFAASLRARAAFSAAMLAANQGDFSSTARLAEQGWELFQELGDTLGAANATVMLARAAWSAGDLDRAVDLLLGAQKTYKEIGDRQRQSTVLNNLGLVETQRGRLDEARRLLEECLALKRELQDELGVAGTLHNLGSLGQREGDFERAEGLQLESLAIGRRLGNKRSIATALAGLGRARAAKGERDAARDNYAEALRLANEAGDLALAAECLEGLASAAAAAGQWERAAKLLGAAEVLRERTGAHPPSIEREEVERTVAETRGAMAPAAFSTAWAKGRAMRTADAVEMALSNEDEEVPQSTRPG